MIRATFPTIAVTAAATPGGSRRTIRGTAVPWGVPGRVSDGRTVIFEPGSLDASARPVALFDHDRGRPIGRVVDASDDGERLAAAVRVSAVPDGDTALVLAADGVRGAFSVGAEPTEWTEDPDGTLRITAADWLELSLLTMGAFDGARVASVTAADFAAAINIGRNPMLTDTDPTATDDPVDPDDDDTTEPNEDIEPDEPVQTQLVPAVPISAARATARRPGGPADVDLRGISRLVMAARGGDERARRAVYAAISTTGPIEAALANVTMVGTGNVGGAYRPTYQAELLEIVSMGSPVVDILRQGDLERGDYPNKTFNAWTATPQVALQATEKAEINSTPVSIGPASVPVQTWATGNDISQQTLDFGSPSFVEDYIRAAAVDYAEVIDTYAVTALLAAATNVATAADDTFITVVQKLLGGLNPTKVPAGGLFLATSYDVGVGLIGVQQNDGPAFWDGSVSFGSFQPKAEMSGMTVIVDPNLPARTYLMGMRNAATWYDLPGTPFNLRAINVGHLGLDIAVYGYGALGVQYPLAFVKSTQPAGT